jgi:dipeptidyl-peptidase-4
MRKFIPILLIFFVSLISAQEVKHLSLEDAVLGGSKGLTPIQDSYQWVDKTDKFVFIKDNALFMVNGADLSLVKSASVLDLTELQKSIVDIKGIPFPFLNITEDEFTFNNQKAIIRYNYKNNEVSEKINYPEESENIDFNAQANAVAYTIENNLYIATSANPKIVVTNSENKNIVSGQAIARSEFGITHGIFWSPGGNLLAFYQKDETKVTDYPLVDVTTTPATLTNIKYPMNGMNSEIPKVGVYDKNTAKLVYLDIDTSDEHYLTNLSWSPDNKFVFLAEINRDQNHMWFTMYDASSGKKIRTLFEEKNDKWVEPENTAVFLPNSNAEFLWLSERDGFMNIYLYDINKGFVKQLTNYKWVVKGIVGFDESKKQVIISGTGDDPREMRYFKVSLKNGETKTLTSESGSHDAQLSPKGNYLIDSYSSINIPGIQKIKDIKRGKEQVLFTSENPLKNYELGTTEFVTLKAKNGVDLYGRIIKPANFDATKKYPVLIYVYGGPHAQMVTNSWMGGSNLWMQYMAAEQGYILFTLDNQGSENRGFAFESIIHRQVGEQEMEDQLLGVDYLKSLPYVDANRFAIFGWSYGGFMTNSLMLRHPGIFTTAVAGGPVTDWKWYEIMYGERYMDRWQENEEGFNKSRVHNYVQNLDGKLLEIIGSVDPVVVPQHTMTLLDAFVKNKKQVDFFSYPMHPHNVRGLDRVHLVTKVLDYIIENNR